MMSVETGSARASDTNTLLGHLATRFQAHPENLATEALAYILQRSVNAANGLHSLLSRCGASLPFPLTYGTQVAAEDGEIPDLVASDELGKLAFILESKFWSGLTDHQPVTYLQHLPANRAGPLLFVVPGLRLAFLWGEMVARCRNAGLDLGAAFDASPEIKTCTVNGQHTLVCGSWREILTALSLLVFADDPVIGDLTQLKGLTTRMDTDAFVPLRSEELTSNMSEQMIQYCHLVDDIAGAVVTAGLARSVGKRSSSTAAAYYQPFAIKGHTCYVQLNCKWWAKYRPTPIWLSIHETVTSINPRAASPLPRYLASLLSGPRPKAINGGGTMLIPIGLQAGAERPALIKSAVQQIRSVVDLLEKLV